MSRDERKRIERRLVHKGVTTRKVLVDQKIVKLHSLLTVWAHLGVLESYMLPPASGMVLGLPRDLLGTS